MKIEITYLALVTDDKQIPIFDDAVYREIGAMRDEEADLTKFFSGNTKGLSLKKGGVRFQYDRESKNIYSVATYFSDTTLSEIQLRELVVLTTDLMDKGYYGEDGWFLDIRQSSYYLQLVEPSGKAAKPVSVLCTPENV